MQWLARLDVLLPVDVLERAPSLWEKLQVLLGARLKLDTERVRDRIEAATFVYEFRRALDALGIDNARSLIIDGTVVFNDDKGVPGDLPDLSIAFQEHVSIFGDGFEELRLAVEHVEAGLDLELEARIAPEHRSGEPSSRIAISGRIAGIGYAEPDALPRVEPASLIAARQAFEAFVAKVAGALGRVLPEAKVTTSLEEVVIRRRLASEKPPAATTPRARVPSGRPPPKAGGAGGGTAVPQRNFTITLEQRIAGIVNGPPPYSVRRRRIEDLEAKLLAMAESLGDGDPLPYAAQGDIKRMNLLIADHNRYYPIEANLAIDPETGRLRDLNGQPWAPMPPATPESIRVLARASREAR